MRQKLERFTWSWSWKTVVVIHRYFQHNEYDVVSGWKRQGANALRHLKTVGTDSLWPSVMFNRSRRKPEPSETQHICACQQWEGLHSEVTALLVSEILLGLKKELAVKPENITVSVTLYKCWEVFILSHASPLLCRWKCCFAILEQIFLNYCRMNCQSWSPEDWSLVIDWLVPPWRDFLFLKWLENHTWFACH